MKKLVLSAFAAVAVFAVAAPSHAAPPNPAEPQGRKCGFNSTTDVTKEAGWQTGDVNGGPLVAPTKGRIRCSIHVNNNTHNGAVATGGGYFYGTDDTTTVLAPTPVNYKATAADDISLCTEWVGDNGVTLYWVSGNTTAAQLGGWSTDPNSTCGVADSIEPNDPECKIWKAIDNRAGTPLAETWQDCEPYDPII